MFLAKDIISLLKLPHEGNTQRQFSAFKTLVDALNARTGQVTVSYSIEINSAKTDMDADTAAVDGGQLLDHDGLDA